ncbi:phosphatase PAP2 family protein [Amycolatopsis sp. NPDC051903]|uniref:phosphatase PAP2 family protein n=1 Tax=Amycolatopsis sp. NPDC051903 TaxID=3363936 RepID=UPI0037BD63DE
MPIALRPTGSGSGLYDAITAFGVSTPGWVQGLVLAYTGYGLALVVPLFAWVWWRARAEGGAERMALALLAPIGTVVAYVVSEVVKSFVHEERPCRGLPASAIAGECPPPGDWSFPSNHSTIAAAAVVGVVFAWRHVWPWLGALAAAMGFSRTFVGAHYPHDVLVGLCLGAGVAALLHRYALAPVTDLVTRLAGRVPARLLGPGATPRPDDPTDVIPRPAPAPTVLTRTRPSADRRPAARGPRPAPGLPRRQPGATTPTRQFPPVPRPTSGQPGPHQPPTPRRPRRPHPGQPRRPPHGR